ncbi:MAG: alpha/beta hydrolase [Candidatus Dojkabacteria bacterium]|nr:MAG: alpha/beta hydrolase [Candidatus Dojkabacteria bacterium]
MSRVNTASTRLTVNPLYSGLLNQSITIKKTKLSLWSFGKIDPEKPTIIGISGWPFSAYTLWPLMSEIPNVQFVGIDIPGFIGFSPALKENVTTETIGQLVAGIVGKLKLQKYGLFGISAGGAYSLASYTALQAKYGKKQSLLSILFNGRRSYLPEFLILTAPALHGTNIAYIRNPETTKRVLEEMKKRETLLDFAYKTINTSFGRSVLREIVYRTNKELRETGEIIDVINIELNKQLKYLDRNALLSSAEDLIHGDFRHELKKVTIPSLFLTGDKDVIVPVEDTKEFASLTKNSQYEAIKDAPHFLVVTHYQEMAKRMYYFLRSIGFTR